MGLQRSSVLRHLVAAVVMFALTLAGAGRGLAAASYAPDAVQAVEGNAFPICHASGVKPSNPADTIHHDCCEHCALCASVLLPSCPAIAGPVSVEHVAIHATGMDWAPTVARVRTPRQSQGPPAA